MAVRLNTLYSYQPRRAAQAFLVMLLANVALGDSGIRKLSPRRLLFQPPEGITINYLDDGLEAFRKSHTAKPVALCLVVRDEDVQEWVEHHRSIGITQIYVYDDQSNPPLLGSLMNDINTGLVHYQYTLRTGDGGIQLDTYTQCLNDHGHKHEWMGFLDADEFLVVRDTGYKHNIHMFLKQYEDFGGLAVNWRVYGSGGHLYWPHASKVTTATSTLKTYTKCMAEDAGVNHHIKTFCQPRYTVAAVNPHFFKYKEGFFAVSPDRTKVPEAFSDNVQVGQISCNHYLAKSWAEWIIKLSRGSADGDHKHGFEHYNAVNELCTEYCPYDE